MPTSCNDPIPNPVRAREKKIENIYLYIPPPLSLDHAPPRPPCPPPLCLGQYPGQIQGSAGLQIKFSEWFTTEKTWALDFSGAGVSPSGFFWTLFFLGRPGPCGTGPPSPLEWIPALPLVTAVLIAPKGAEPPGSGRMGMMCALVFYFPSDSEDV